MSMFDTIIANYPELENNLDEFNGLGSIVLRDDGDGIQYVARWEYSKPLPDGLKLGK
jgi:hypothetical protein